MPFLPPRTDAWRTLRDGLVVVKRKKGYPSGLGHGAVPDRAATARSASARCAGAAAVCGSLDKDNRARPRNRRSHMASQSSPPASREDTPPILVSIELFWRQQRDSGRTAGCSVASWRCSSSPVCRRSCLSARLTPGPDAVLPRRCLSPWRRSWPVWASVPWWADDRRPHRKYDGRVPHGWLASPCKGNPPPGTV